MNRLSITNALAFAAALLLSPLSGHAFDSGSKGADGAFNPVTDTELQLPPDGVFNFTSVHIPSLVKVTFKRNATNTPVVMLAQGDIVVEGTINVSGKAAAPTGPSGGDGNPADDGLPGEGGAGGFDGGRGGISASSVPLGGNGLGPGGGAQGFYQYPSNRGGGHGSYGTSGSYNEGKAAAGPTYGNELIRPLIGGSGGGGGPAPGKGGGGGGGAILLAASGEIRLVGAIYAYGGATGLGDGNYPGGGGGSGGAIRLVASQVSGRGSLNAAGGGGTPRGPLRVPDASASRPIH